MISESKNLYSCAELKLKELRSFKIKIDNILSRKRALANINQKTNESIKLKFYESNDLEIDKLEAIKISSEAMFQNIKISYQSDQNLINLLQTEHEVRDIYIKYIETYNDYSRKIRETIESLKAESCSPYIYEDAKFLFLFDNMASDCELFQYDIEKSQQNKINIDFFGSRISDILTVLLPNNELFFLAKYCSNSPITCIIDLNSYTIKRILPSIYYNYKSGIFYYQKNVYIIGGRCDHDDDFRLPFKSFSKLRTLNKRFDLILEKWVSLSPLPELLTSCSAVPFKNKVLIAGNESKNYIYEYDIALNGFSEIDFNIEHTRILLLTGNSRVYLLEIQMSIWESQPDNEYVWNKIDWLYIGLPNEQFYRVENKRKVYFGCVNNYDDKTFSYFEFDLVKKKFKEIQSFKAQTEG